MPFSFKFWNSPSFKFLLFKIGHVQAAFLWYRVCSHQKDGNLLPRRNLFISRALIRKSRFVFALLTISLPEDPVFEIKSQKNLNFFELLKFFEGLNL